MPHRRPHPDARGSPTGDTRQQHTAYYYVVMSDDTQICMTILFLSFLSCSGGPNSNTGLRPVLGDLTPILTAPVAPLQRLRPRRPVRAAPQEASYRFGSDSVDVLAFGSDSVRTCSPWEATPRFDQTRPRSDQTRPI